MSRFVHVQPSTDAFWRAIILFGRNVACYKFAFAATLLDLGRAGKTRATLPELAEPYADRICDHLKRFDRQGTSSSSRFLEACRKFNAGELPREDLLEATARLGFVDVIDAFHMVGQTEVETRFFDDDRKGSGSLSAPPLRLG